MDSINGFDWASSGFRFGPTNRVGPGSRVATFHVSMLRKYTPDPTHVMDWGDLVVDVDATFKEGLIHIMDNREQVLRGKTVKLVKVLWQH